jgi:hypothetical protein
MTSKPFASTRSIPVPANVRSTASPRQGYMDKVVAVIWGDMPLLKEEVTGAICKDYSHVAWTGFNPDVENLVIFRQKEKEYANRNTGATQNFVTQRRFRLLPDGTVLRVTRDADSPTDTTEEIGTWVFEPASEQATYIRQITQYFKVNPDGSRGEEIEARDAISRVVGKNVTWYTRSLLMGEVPVAAVTKQFKEVGNVLTLADGTQAAYRNFIGHIVVTVGNEVAKWPVNNKETRMIEASRVSYLKRALQADFSQIFNEEPGTLTGWLNLSREQRRNPNARRFAPRPVIECYIPNVDAVVNGPDAYFVKKDKWITAEQAANLTDIDDAVEAGEVGDTDNMSEVESEYES